MPNNKDNSLLPGYLSLEVGSFVMTQSTFICFFQSLAQLPMKGGMRDFKLFGEALGNPIEEIGISDAYDGLPYNSAIHFGENGGYVQKYSKPLVLFFPFGMAVTF